MVFSEEMSDKDLWTRITQKPRPHRIVNFTINGEDCQIAIMTLTGAQAQIINLDSEKYTDEMIKKYVKNVGKTKEEFSMSYSHIYQDKIVVETLFTACRKPEDLTSSFFPSSMSISKYLSQDEIAVLFSMYLETRSDLSCILGELTAEQIDAAIERLADGGGEDFLASLSLEATKQLMRHMASRLLKLQMHNDLPGLQHVEIL